jgi:hypothetical protein
MVASPNGLGSEKNYPGNGQQNMQKAYLCSRQRERSTTILQLANSNKDLVMSPIY